MDKLASLWLFVRRRKYLITFVLFVVLVGFLDENSIVRRLGYYREETRLRGEIDRYRTEYEENTRRLNELAVDSGAIEKIAREKYLMKKPNEDIYVKMIEKNETTDTRPFCSRSCNASDRRCRLCHRMATLALYIYDRCDICCFSAHKFTFKMQKSHYQTSAAPADIRRVALGAYRSFYVLYAW